MKRVFFAILLFALVVLFAGCEASKGITIAYAAPMTGESAKMGDDISKGVKLAIDEWNAKGGINGKRVYVEGFDDRADPKEAVSVAQRAISKGVKGMIGHYNSSCTIPASDLYNEAGIVMITPASTNPQVTSRALKLVFRTCGRDDQQGKVMAQAVSAHGASKVAILHDKTTYGQGLADEFKKNLASNAEVVIYESIQRGEKDFSAVLTKVKALKPDYLMYGGVYIEGGLVAKQMRDLGLTAKFVSGDGVYDPEFIRVAGKAAEDAWLTYAPPSDQIPSAQSFLANFKSKFGEMGPYSLFSYDATNILLSAILKNPKATGAELAEIIRATSWDMASGRIDYDENGDPKNAPYVMWTVHDGKLVIAKIGS